MDFRPKRIDLIHECHLSVLLRKSWVRGLDPRAMFNSDRCFYEKLQDTGTYLDSIAEHETLIEVYTVEDLLNDIENAELLKTLLAVDKLTLQISVLSMNVICPSSYEKAG